MYVFKSILVDGRQFQQGDIDVRQYYEQKATKLEALVLSYCTRII